ncbi:hypothetical protein ACFPOE_07340 [Caenimonas terrae]|uniref:SdpA family antimicrobial peptide system protein n=1 Tax=Caenimonas terrae TaxID=696074 RepID=A0ABW0N9I9_9BURK
MKSKNWKSVPFIVSASLVITALLLSVVAWCFSDAGLANIQRHWMRDYGEMKWRPVSLTYSGQWIVETVSRPTDGAVLTYGLWPSGKTIPSGTASIGLKRRVTGEQASIVLAPLAPDNGRSSNFAECLRTAACRSASSFLGLTTPATVVSVHDGEWAVLERFATSVLVLNPGHASTSDLQLQPTSH